MKKLFFFFQKRKQEVKRVLAATTSKVEKMQQRINKESQRKIGKLEKKVKSFFLINVSSWLPYYKCLNIYALY